MTKLNKVLVAVLFGAQAAFASTAAMAEDMVNNYVESPSGSVVTNPYGECWRTPYQDTAEKLEGVVTRSRNRCRLVVATPTAPTITAKVMEEITIAASMLFAFDSAELSDDAKAVIDERIQSLKVAPS